MILILSIEDKNNASWLIVEGKDKKDSLSFKLDRDNDKTFSTLDKLLSNNDINLQNLSALALIIKEVGLTQVKVFTAIINTFAWQLDVPVAGEYYYENSFENAISKVLDKIKNNKSKILQIEYKQNPDISTSKKVPKYVIKK